MENISLSQNMKAILIKIAMELKKLGWKPDTQSNEINLYQDFISMAKEYVVKNVDVSIGVAIKLFKGEPGDNYFVTYKGEISLWVEGAGGKDISDENDIDVPLKEEDVSNTGKFIEIANQINNLLTVIANDTAEEYSIETHSDWEDNAKYKNF